MKRSIIMACALAIGSSLGLAEDKTASTGVSTSSPSTSQYQPEQMQLFDSSVIENKKITDSSGKNLGKLERLLIDSKSGQVRFAVVQVDKEWSLNDPEVIIPWRTLQISRAGDKDLALKIDTDRDKLMKAPHFDKALVHQLNTREAGQPIYTYWGVTWEDMPASSTSETVSTPASSNVSGTSASSSTATPAPSSTSPSPTSTTSSTSEATTSTPTTPTDGSVGTQPLGNTGTSDSPTPNSSQVGDDNNTIPVEPDQPDQPNRTLGGDQTD